jgi:hypothetical protein
MKIHPSKVAAIADWDRPTNGKEVRSFMGTANWPRKLVKDIAILGDRYNAYLIYRSESFTVSIYQEVNLQIISNQTNHETADKHSKPRV